MSNVQLWSTHGGWDSWVTRIVCHCHLGLLAWLHCMCLQLQMAVVKTFFKLRIQAFLHSVQTVVLQNAKSWMTFDVCRAYFNSVKSGLHGGRFQDDLKNVFAGKSTSTLHNRAGPFLRYLHFCSCSQLSALPLSEDVVYAFMQSEENRSAPTFLKSFMSSLAFACHAVGLLSAKHVIDSKRVKGLVDRCYLLKRKTRSRQPLRVDELATLEEIVVGRKNKSIADRHAAGCFLFMVYARARFSDMLNVGKLEFDNSDTSQTAKGYIEAQVARSKTSFSMDRKVRLLPMTASMFGVISEPWGAAWQDVILKAGIQVGSGKPLLPGRTPDGWHTLPLTAEAGTSWLRNLLQTGEYFQDGRFAMIGTHSCKSTCLPWMAKWGSSPTFAGWWVTMLQTRCQQCSSTERTIPVQAWERLTPSWRPSSPTTLCLTPNGLTCSRPWKLLQTSLMIKMRKNLTGIAQRARQKIRPTKISRTMQLLKRQWTLLSGRKARDREIGDNVTKFEPEKAKEQREPDEIIMHSSQDGLQMCAASKVFCASRLMAGMQLFAHSIATLPSLTRTQLRPTKPI